MNTPHDDLHQPWERRLHEELRALPDLEAPASLVPGVMAALRARQAAAAQPAWYRRPASTWPSALRVTFGVCSLAAFAALLFGLRLLGPSVVATAESGSLADLGQRAGTFWTIATTLFDALALVLRAVASSPWFLAAAAVAGLSYLTLLGAGSALWRLAAQPRHAHE